MRYFLPYAVACLFFATHTLMAQDPVQDDLLLLDNGTVKIGINRAKGASITWLSWATYPMNMVNSHDPGRLIQQSYYAGKMLDRKAEGQHEAWSPWSWNPIQGGGIGSWARVEVFKRIDAQTLYGETIPKLWDMPNEEATALMRQWTGFEPGMPNVLRIRCKFISERAPDDRWGTTPRSPQEVPACYFTRNFDTLKSYLGGGKWREESAAIGPPWNHARPPRGAMACFNSDGQGVAVFSPSGESWNFGPHAGGRSADPSAAPCVHLAPVILARLAPRATFTYRYWLVVGTETQIEDRLEALWSLYAGERPEIARP